MKDNFRKQNGVLRQNRIEQLGAFGSKRTQKMPDKTKYNRKSKHKRPTDDRGSFLLLDKTI